MSDTTEPIDDPTMTPERWEMLNEDLAPIDEMLADDSLSDGVKTILLQRRNYMVLIHTGMAELADSHLAVPPHMIDAIHTDALLDTLLGDMKSESRQAFHCEVDRRVYEQLIAPMIADLPRLREEVAAMQARELLLSGGAGVAHGGGRMIRDNPQA